MQVIDKKFLKLGQDKKGDINESQLILLGLESMDNYEEVSNGKNISDARAELFVLLKGIKAKSNQDKIIANYKALQEFRKTPQDTKEDAIVNKNDETFSGSDIAIYCDGGCSPNPGESGSGIAVYVGGSVKELWYGLYEKMGTNNTAELNALYESLLMAQKNLENTNKVEIKCDSMYSINCIKTWAISWERNGWKKKGGEIKNLEIIKKAYKLYNTIKKDIVLSHIKAHAGLEGNELADRMTVYARDTKEACLKKYNKAIDISSILKMRAG